MHYRLLSALFLLAIVSLSAQAEERKVKVQFDTPATNYGVQIQRVYEVEDTLWVVSKVLKHGDFGGAAITRVSDEVTVDADAEVPIVHKVIGKSWGWGDDSKTLQYVKSADALEKSLKDASAKLIWQRKKAVRE